ncbi:protein-associating with the carboxyl-terminal domain of ezrin-like [Gigantopelta aegis]|uniref:protein-associating with the carboxyl-terminal domain of ezrin-like n=1 Tax=Gigantopelta aegis TaxID=1735272 RepID=UPI001B88ADFD|nr:protein-associating with the carboxyl-terminal domain of ezrin-like [Gigantopelta aegis]
MGAENSVLADCEWGDEIKVPSNMDWKMTKATLKDETHVTIFQHKKNNKKAGDLLENGTKNLKALRHPDILKFISSGENVDGSSYLVTEQVEPLELQISTLSPIELCAGLHSVLKALVFLHDTVGVCHNNVCLSSLYVTDDGSWRLGGLEHVCKYKEVTPEFLEKCLAFRNSEAIAPEEEDGSLEISIDFGYVRDVYAFGVLAESMLEKLNDLGEATKTFELRILDECLNDDPKKRPKLKELLNDRLFRQDFLGILNFLKTVATKTSEEKKDFFRSLTEKLLGLPEELVAKRLVVLLLSRFVVLDESAKQYMIPSLLTPYRGDKRPDYHKGPKRPVLHTSLFKLYVIPVLSKIFQIREVHIRLALLAHFSSYVDLFEKEILEDSIVIQLLLGLRDTNDALVAASLHALAEVVPFLGADVIIGGTRKKFFTEGMPKFGNIHDGIGKNMSGAMGKKILLKDLATMSNGEITLGNSEKRKEKEQRREEARRRREERKIQHREKRLKDSKTSIAVEKIPTKIMKESSETNENANSKLHPSSDLVPGDDFANQESDSPEWDSWDGERENDTSLYEDGELSDEIEKELENMPTTIAFKESQDNCSKSDISDSMRSSGYKLKSALKLSGKSKQQNASRVHFVDQNHLNSERSLEWGPTLDDRSQEYNTESHANTKSVNADHGNKVTSSLNVPLGSEFDVKSIEIKPKISVELDFFADMAPEIKSGPKDPLTLIMNETSQLKESKGLSDETAHAQEISFAVLSTPESTDDASGWGDDLDWGSENL